MGRRAPAGRFKLPTLRPQDIEDHPSASRAPASVKIKVYGPIGRVEIATNPPRLKAAAASSASKSKSKRKAPPLVRPFADLASATAFAANASGDGFGGDGDGADGDGADGDGADGDGADGDGADGDGADSDGEAMYEDHGGFDHGFRQDTPPPIIEPCPLETYESQNVEQMTEDQLRSELAPVITPTQTRERLETTYSAFLTREARLRKFERPRLFVQYLSFMIDSNSRLNPRIIEVEGREGHHSIHCRRQVVSFPLDVTFCPLSNTGNPCVTYAERLAQIGLMGATASNLYSAFTFQVLQLVESCWAVDPSSVEGMAQGMDDYYERCGWGDSGALSPHQFDREPRKQWQRALDEFRALAAHEAEFNDRLLNIKDSYAYKCPACFGPTILNQPNQAPKLDHLIAIDGNFQQWRNQAAKHDPQATTPDLFISAAEISEMKEAVEKTKTPSKKACTESWKAADDGAEKFWAGKSDTGLVACVCRHDVVLKMVNLEKSGEKLYYALALIKHVSERVGPEAKIGVLYDIACNLKHHIQKRELLPELAPRLEFAASVFHAFAHQWSCQVEFNPQLISNFGCTDGEGCERLWSSLRSLIPINRPSTRSHRLDNVARRSIELNCSSMDNLGYWMHRKHTRAETKLEQAQACLDRVKESDPRWTESALLLQWEDQRTAQAAKTTAEQDRENQTLRMKMYAILIELHEQDLALFEVGETGDPAVKASHEAKRRAILARFDARTAGNERASVLDFRHMCSCSIALRHLRSEVIAFQMSQVKLNSMRRGKGGATLGQRNVAKIKAMGSKGQYQVEKAMKMYNTAVENFRTEASPSFQSVLDGLQLADGFQSIMSKHETDAFWQDGFFTHYLAEWAIDPLVKEGIHALQSKSRAQEELQRLGAEVRQALAWLEDAVKNLRTVKERWISQHGEY
ncbi:BQ2448_6438 [Microbotryum intermedium]|uniref:BQ2448_6438 protein n=1 Tax=Microbotryum intermedium TaxID=269621 RepID=A0A238FSC1_9BASI|nr:BQ2448_6438 [Microbotryum intermedium]